MNIPVDKWDSLNYVTTGGKGRVLILDFMLKCTEYYMTPDKLQKALQSEEPVLVGFMIGDTVTDAGRVVEATHSAKTLRTDRGYEFKYRWKQGKYALTGNANNKMVLVQKSSDSRQ